VSGLAKLLAGRAVPGVYHWTSAADAADVRHAVDQAQWRLVSLDTWGTEDKAGLMAACQQAFDLPDWFGRNFDALGDALSDVRAGGDLRGVVVMWDGWGPLARAERRVFDVAVDVFSARVDDDRAGPFAVLLRGPGPDDIDLVEL
jgi:RNAse (barnase) inhibitor barstar